MNIVGTGYLARQLRPVQAAHPGVTVLAAGVPRHPVPETEYQREARLVEAVITDCLRRDDQLVFFSTVSMYGGPGSCGREDDDLVASTRYGRHKLDLERVIQRSRVRHLVLRLGYVLGPHGPDYRLVPALIRQIQAGRVTVQQGARRDMIYVSDWVRVVDRLLATRVSDEIINVASGDCAPIVGVIDVLERFLGVTAQRVAAESTVSHCASIDKLRRLVPEVVAELGFGPGYHHRALARFLAESDVRGSAAPPTRPAGLSRTATAG